MTIPLAGHPVGREANKTKSEKDLVNAAYRFLIADLFPFGNRAVIGLEHGGGNTSTEHYSGVAYWYGSPSPTLVATDQLNVCDEADAKLHDYKSPTAEAPYKLASRYEWGPDHDEPGWWHEKGVQATGAREFYPAEEDSVRIMRGVSEFTMQLDPDNHGVMLRRKFDYQYPNQRAKVSVRPAGSDEPWQYVGEWYTAGSNTCVHSRPGGDNFSPAELGPDRAQRHHQQPPLARRRVPHPQPPNPRPRPPRHSHRARPRRPPALSRPSVPGEERLERIPLLGVLLPSARTETQQQWVTFMTPARRLVLYIAAANVALLPLVALAHPGSGIVVDAKGQVYFTDTGEGVWKIDADGKLVRMPGSAWHFMAGDLAGHFANSPNTFGEWFERASPRGSKPTLILCSDFPCTIAEDGNLYFANTLPFFSDNPRPTLIVRRTQAGQQTVITVGEGTQSQKASESDIGKPLLGHVTGLAASGDGSIYIMQSPPDSEAHAILKLNIDGDLTEFASNFLNRDDGVELQTGVSKTYCRGLAVDEGEDVYVAVTGGRRIVKVSPQGEVSNVLQSEKPWSPTGVALLGDELYVLEYSDFPPGWNPDDRRGWAPRVRKVDREGKVITLATVARENKK